MCRLTVYKGRPILIGDIVITPENSLLYQSRDAAYHPGVIDKANQRNILVNGDGFGISWYGAEPEKGSCCFKFVTPAWSDTNLRNIGRHVSSQLVFAHVRAAASGHNPFEPMIVSNENCHPFTYKDYTFMHNGGIPSFQTIKLKILNLLSPETFANIKGTTDTEHIFAIYLNCLPHREEGQQHTVMDMVDAMNQTISIVLQLCAENGITDYCSLNLCVSNGVHVIATRFRTGPKAPPSLYYNIGANFVCKNGHFYAEDATSATEIVISSAPLSKVCHHQGMEVEQDVSFAEEGGESANGLGTPTGRSSLGATGRTSMSGGIRPNLSTNSLRALLAPSAQAQSRAQEANEVEADSDGDSDIGSWILIPRNHMLVCEGAAQAPHQLQSVYLEHITVAAPHCPLVRPLNSCKRKAEAEPAAAPRVSTPGMDQQLDAGLFPDSKRKCTGECTFTLGDEDLSDGTAGTTTLSACSSVSSTDGLNAESNLSRHNSAASDSGTGATPRSGCIGVAFSPSCKQKPKVIKFACQM